MRHRCRMSQRFGPLFTLLATKRLRFRALMNITNIGGEKYDL